MTDTTTNEIIRACTNLVVGFAYHVDHREFDQAVSLFTENGCFERPDLTARGHREIAAIWAHRPNSVITRHICGPTFFKEVSEQQVIAVTYFTLYHVVVEGEAPPHLELPAAIAEFHDVFQPTAAGWRIAYRKGIPIIFAK